MRRNETHDALFRRGEAQLAEHRYADAQATFEQMLRRRADDAVAHNGLGVAFDKLGRTEDAAAAFRASLAADPNLGVAACNLGRMLLYLGDIDEAVACFERAVALEPGSTMFQRCLVNARGGRIEPAQLAHLERLAAALDTLSAPERIDLHFALASAYERAGRYDDAFGHLQAGNATKRAVTPYDADAHMSLFASLEALCSEEVLAGLRGSGDPSARPIFILGMPRSGTTLVEQLLAAHPAVAAGGELDVFERAIRAELFDGDPDAGDVPERVRAVAQRYLRATDPIANEAPHLTDKTNANFCFAPLIHVAFPNARLIHVRRDPLDTCFSCYATGFGEPRLAYTDDLRDLGRYYVAYERMMARWRALLPPGRFIEVDYERLVADIEGEARRLLAWCELAWDPGVLAFHRVRRTVRTASVLQVRQPLSAGSVGRASRFAAHLGPLAEELRAVAASGDPAAVDVAEPHRAIDLGRRLQDNG